MPRLWPTRSWNQAFGFRNRKDLFSRRSKGERLLKKNVLKETSFFYEPAGPLRFLTGTGVFARRRQERVTCHSISAHWQCLGRPSEGPVLWPRKCIGGRLLEDLAKVAGIAVDTRALHHEDVSKPADRVYPSLRAPCPSMTEGAGREHLRHTWVGSLEDGHTNPPAVVHSPIAIFFGLQKAGLEFAGVHGGELLKGRGAKIALAAKGSAV